MGIGPIDRNGSAPPGVGVGHGTGDSQGYVPADTSGGGDSYGLAKPRRPTPSLPLVPGVLGGVELPPLAAGSAAAAPSALPDPMEDFEGAVQEAAGADASEGRIDTIRDSFRYALDTLREKFGAEERPSGQIPGESLVETALGQAYYNVTGSRLPKDGRELSRLSYIFYRHIERHAAALGLVGQMAKREGARPEPADTARQVMEARVLLDEMEASFSQIPEGARDRPSANAGGHAPRAILEVGQRLVRELGELGADAAQVETRLNIARTIDLALGKARRISQINDQLRYVRLEHLEIPPHPLNGHFLELTRADWDSWIEARVRDDADAEYLREAVAHYIAHWLGGQRGDLPPRLTFDMSSLEYAIARTRGTMTDVAALERFHTLGPRLIHSIVRQEARKSRSPRASVASSTATMPAIATPHTRRVRNVAELEGFFGREFVQNFSSFHLGVRDGRIGNFANSDRARDVADAFYMLVFSYLRLFANTYGDNLGGELAARGLEPSLVHAVFARVHGANTRFDRDALEMLREFFVRHVRTDEPAAAGLRPQASSRTTAQRALHQRYIPYEDGMGMREFVGGTRSIAGGVSTSFKERFERETGISWATLMNWGGTQARPPDKTDAQWNAHVDKKKKAGEIEDVTTEPTRHDSLDAILPAYFFLQREALANGQRVDFFDFLSAIYPIARRYRAESQDGVVSVLVPSFMREFPPSNWGYATWARLIMQSGLPTEVVRSTLDTHMRGGVDNPEYDTIRRYAAPLAAADASGDDGYIAIYRFAAGVLRWAYLLDSAVRVYDSDDSIITRPSGGVDTRYRVRLEYDSAEYAAGAAPATGSMRAVFSDARRDIYRDGLALAGDYLTTVALMPEGVALSTADGGALEISDLQEELAGLVSQEAQWRSELLDESITGQRSWEDNQRIHGFYRGVQGFLNRVAHFTHVRGFVETRYGNLGFQAIPVVADGGVELISGEYATIPVADIARAAVREGWPQQRVADLLRLRTIIAHQVVTRGIERPATAAQVTALVSEWWPRDARSADGTIADYLRLEDESSRVGVKSTLPSLPTTGGRRARVGFEPFLGRAAREWQAVFWDFVDDRKIPEADAQRLLLAIGAYFQTTRGFYRQFYPGALRHAIAEAGFAGANEAERMYAAVTEFFRQIAVASDEAPWYPASPSGDASVEGMAVAVLGRYLSLFPQPASGQAEPVPVDANLLSHFVARFIDEHPELRVRHMALLGVARAGLTAYNTTTERAHAVESRTLPPNQVRGLFSERLGSYESSWRATHGGDIPNRDIVTRAYYRLLPMVRQRAPISREDVARAISQSSGGREAIREETDFLEGLIRRQAADIERLIVAIRDRDTGLIQHVRAHHRAEYITDEGLETLAVSAAVAMVTVDQVVDVGAIARDVTHPAFAPYTAVVERVADSLRALFGEWARGASQDSETQVADVMVGLDLIADERTRPAASYSEFTTRSASEVGDTPFEELSTRDRTSRVLGRLAGVVSIDPPLEEAAARLYTERVVPARTVYEKPLRKELARFGERVAEFARQSLELYQDITRDRDVSSMEKERATRFIAEMDAGAMTLLGLHDEMDAIARSRDRIRKITQELGLDQGFVEAGIDEILRSAEILLGRADDARDHVEAAARERLAVIAVEEDTARRETAAAAEAARIAEGEARQREAEAAATMAHAKAVAGATRALETRTAIIDAALARIHERETEAPQHTRAMEAIPSAHTSYDAFRAAVRLADEFTAARASFETQLTSAERELLLTREGGFADPRTGQTDKRSAAQMIERATGLLEARGSEHDLALRAALAGIGERLGAIESALANLARIRQELASASTQATEALLAAEGRLPVTPPREVYVPASLPEDEGGFAEGLVGENPHEEIVETLRPFIEASVVTHEHGSYMIPSHEAERLRLWLGGRREAAITVRSIFIGNEVVFSVGERGVHIVEGDWPSEVTAFRVIRDALTLAVSNDSIEARLISTLVRTSNGGRQFFYELMIALAASGPFADADSVATVIRRWAAVNRESLERELGQAAQEWFVPEGHQDSIPQHGARGKIYGDGYTPEEHQHWAAAHASTIERPIPKGESEVLHAYIAMSHILYQIYSDPSLMELGWLLRESSQGHLDPSFSDYLDRLFVPLLFLPPGAEPPVSLHEVQERAALQYSRVAEGYSQFPEIGNIFTIFSTADLPKTPMWRALAEEGDTGMTPRAARNLTRAMRRNYALGRTMWMIYLLGVWADRAMRESEARGLDGAQVRGVAAHAREAVRAIMRHFARADTISEDLHEIPILQRTREIYARWRPRILEDERDQLMALTRMRRPESDKAVEPPDALLGRAFPETARVGPTQAAQVKRDTHENPPVDLPRDLRGSVGFMIQQFPEFSGALAIILTVYPSMPQAFHEEFEALVGACDAAMLRPSTKAEDTVRHLGEALNAIPVRLREFYGKWHEAIQTGLVREHHEGMTRARWLTGRDEPWRTEPVPMEAQATATPLREEPLPRSDRWRFARMPMEEIEAKVAALGVLPDDERELARAIDEWKSRATRQAQEWHPEKRHILRKKLETYKQVAIEIVQDAPRVLSMVMLAMDTIDESKGLIEQFTRTMEVSTLPARDLRPGETQGERLARVAYRTLLEHRERVLALAARHRALVARDRAYAAPGPSASSTSEVPQPTDWSLERDVNAFLLEHVGLGTLTAGDEDKFLVNYRDAEAVLRAGGRRFRVYDMEARQWQDIDLPESGQLRLEQRGFRGQMGDRVTFVLASDPSLRELAGWLSDWEGGRLGPGLAIYLSRLITPIELTTEGRPLPFTPHEAQAQAREVIRSRLYVPRQKNALGRSLDAPFVELDEALEKVHPETERVSSFHIWRVLREAELSGPHIPLGFRGVDLVSMPSSATDRLLFFLLMMSYFPEHAGALTIISEMWDALPQAFKDEFQAIARECVITEDRSRPGARLAGVTPFRQRFLDLYHSQAQAGVDGHDAIIRALARERLPGLTYARWLTGWDEPWDRKIPPLEMLAAFLPEYRLVRPEIIARIRETMEAARARTDRLLPHLHVIELVPEVAGMVIFDMLLVSFWEAAAPYIERFYTDSLGMDRAAIIEAFVRFHTRLDYAEGLREFLKKPRGVERRASLQFEPTVLVDIPELTIIEEGGTYAEVLTGSRTPWLPKITLRPAELAAPARAETQAAQALLPPSDAGRIDEMTIEEIKARVDALGILPRNRGRLAKQIQQMRTDQLAHCAHYDRGGQVSDPMELKRMRQELRQGIASLPDIFYGILLALQRVNPALGMQFVIQIFVSSDREKISALRGVRFAYSFLLDHRDDVLAYVRRMGRVEVVDEVAFAGGTLRADLLPTSDLERELTEREIDARITALGILPTDEKKLAMLIREWRQMERRRATSFSGGQLGKKLGGEVDVAKTRRLLVESVNYTSDVHAKIILIMNICDPSRQIEGEMFRAFEGIAEAPAYGALCQEAYRTLVRNRDRILACVPMGDTRGNGTGNGSGVPPGTPPPPTGGGRAPVPTGGDEGPKASSSSAIEAIDLTGIESSEEISPAPDEVVMDGAEFMFSPEMPAMTVFLR